MLGPYPGVEWPTASPAAHDVSETALRAIAQGTMGNATLIRHGVEIFTWGNASQYEPIWSSCGRSYVTTAWGMALTRGEIPGGLAALDRPVRDLPSMRALSFGASIELRHLLSYTSIATPPGSSWSYSCREHWPWQHQVFQEVVGRHPTVYLNAELLPRLGGHLRAITMSDGTTRVEGSPRSQARWGYLWLRGGRWSDGEILHPAFVARALGGGPDGDGRPEPKEGYQIHKAQGGQWSDGLLPGVPDDAFFAAGGGDKAFIVVVPSLDLVVARRRSEGYNIGTWLGDILRAVR